MSGHSKWSKVKRFKGVEDAKKGKIFTKIIKEITIAVKSGGPDENANPKLRLAIENAKSSSMPKDNIERAIKKASGESVDGASLEEYTLEGYGPAGVAFIVKILSENKNRTVANIRHIFSKHNGNLGESGCVSWMFKEKGLITLDKKGIEEDKLYNITLEAGADDITEEGSEYEITTSVNNFSIVKDALVKNKIKYSEATITMIPSTTVKLEKDKAEQVIKLFETLEDDDDVQNVYANFDISEQDLEQLAS